MFEIPPDKLSTLANDKLPAPSVFNTCPTVPSATGKNNETAPMLNLTLPVPDCITVAVAPVVLPIVIVLAILVPISIAPVPESSVNALAPVALPIVIVLANAFVPILIAPVPAFNTSDVAPVPLPIVIVFALEPVPILIAPVVPLSRVSAVVVVVVTPPLSTTWVLVDAPLPVTVASVSASAVK